MKNLITICCAALVAVLFVSCESDKNKGKLDPNAKVYINAAVTPAGVAINQDGQADQAASQADQATSKAYGDQKKLTPREVVEKALGFMTAQWTMGVADWNRDFTKNRFVGGSTWVVGSRGDLTLDFIEATNYIVVTLNADAAPKDTIAYVPNATMRKAEKAIKAAYAAEDYATCYRLFEEAFIFVPTTGFEYKALQAKGEN